MSISCELNPECKNNENGSCNLSNPSIILHDINTEDLDGNLTPLLKCEDFKPNYEHPEFRKL